MMPGLKKETNEFLSVLEAHKCILYKIAHTYCKGTEDRKDLVQETIIQLWKSFENYDPQFKYSTWIYRIALNVAISFYRKEISRKRVSTLIDSNVLYLAEDTIQDDKQDELKMLHKFISELKELDKALMLLYLEEKSHKEISFILGISETNVATKVSRLKASLKLKFKKLLNS